MVCLSTASHPNRRRDLFGLSSDKVPGFQTNLMVQKDGGYGFKDFAKAGSPLTLIVGVVVVVLAPTVYGF
jgi:hypothetical protein